MIVPIMAGYPSKLKSFPQLSNFHNTSYLPLLPLYNAQWWGYESLTAIVLVYIVYIEEMFKEKNDENMFL